MAVAEVEGLVFSVSELSLAQAGRKSYVYFGSNVNREILLCQMTNTERMAGRRVLRALSDSGPAKGF